MEKFFRIGVITGTHGVKGELRVYPTTEEPKRFLDLREIRLEFPNGKNQTMSVAGVRFQPPMVLLRLHGVLSEEEARPLKGAELYVSRYQAIPLEEGEYYVADLLGLPVRTEEGEVIGRMKDVLKTGANDVFVVERDEGKDVLIPVIPQCFLKADLREGFVLVRLLDGLLDL